MLRSRGVFFLSLSKSVIWAGVINWVLKFIAHGWPISHLNLFWVLCKFVCMSKMVVFEDWGADLLIFVTCHPAFVDFHKFAVLTPGEWCKSWNFDVSPSCETPGFPSLSEVRDSPPPNTKTPVGTSPFPASQAASAGWCSRDGLARLPLCLLIAPVWIL